MADAPVVRPADAIGNQIAAVEEMAAAAISSAKIGVASGVAALDSNTLVPSAQIPFGTTTGTVADGGLVTSLQLKLAEQAQQIDLLRKCMLITISTHVSLSQATMELLNSKVAPEAPPVPDSTQVTTEPNAPETVDLVPAVTSETTSAIPTSDALPVHAGSVPEVRPLPDFNTKESSS